MVTVAATGWRQQAERGDRFRARRMDGFCPVMDRLHMTLSRTLMFCLAYAGVDDDLLQARHLMMLENWPHQGRPDLFIESFLQSVLFSPNPARRRISCRRVARRR
jgi:hypothetical protein